MFKKTEVKKHGIKWFGENGEWPKCPECDQQFQMFADIEMDEINGVWILTKKCCYCHAHFTITKIDDPRKRYTIKWLLDDMTITIGDTTTSLKMDCFGRLYANGCFFCGRGEE